MARDYLALHPVRDVSVGHAISTGENASIVLSDMSYETYITSQASSTSTSTFEMGALMLPKSFQINIISCYLYIKVPMIGDNLTSKSHNFTFYLNGTTIETVTHSYTNDTETQFVGLALTTLASSINSYLQENNYADFPLITLEIESNGTNASISDIEVNIDYETEDENSLLNKIFLRPSADISIGHTLNTGTEAYLLINEENPDGQTTYISSKASNEDESTTTSSFLINGAIPKQSNIKITDLRFAYNYSAYESSSGERTTNTITLTLDDISATCVDTEAYVSGNLTTFTTSRLSNFTNKDAFINLLNSYIKSGNLPEITLTLSVVKESQSTKTANQTYITQMYIELDYEISTGLYTKINNEWTMTLQVFKKINNIWTEITPEECKSIMQSSLLKVGQLPTYSVVCNLSNCISDNNILSVTEGKDYNATIIANDGYKFSSVIIKINGIEMNTNDYWIESETEHIGTVAIPNVYGDIEIIIITEEYPLLVDFAYTDNGDGTYTLTDWLGTYKGKQSTICYVPDNESIIL